MVDRVMRAAATALGWTVLALMILLLVGSLIGRRGSLDDLSASQIREAVDG